MRFFLFRHTPLNVVPLVSLLSGVKQNMTQGLNAGRQNIARAVFSTGFHGGNSWFYLLLRDIHNATAYDVYRGLQELMRQNEISRRSPQRSFAALSLRVARQHAISMTSTQAAKELSRHRPACFRR